MNRLTPIADTALATVTRFDHPTGEHHLDPEEEQAGSASVSFIESGAFGLKVGKRRHRLDAATLFVTWPGLVFSCHHADEIPRDVCLSVDFTREFAEEIRVVAASERTLSPVARLTNRLAYLRLSLLQAVGAADRLGTETIAGDVLAEVASARGAAPRPLFKPGQLSWYAARVDSARERMRAEHDQAQALAALAREAGMSPFHFARVFKELVGTPPHRYLREIRLRRAAEMLRQGAGVTQACFGCGFSNLSHFSRSFRRRFGVLPSRLFA